mgnify:CR=1 FL=1
MVLVPYEFWTERTTKREPLMEFGCGTNDVARAVPSSFLEDAHPLPAGERDHATVAKSSGDSCVVLLA